MNAAITSKDFKKMVAEELGGQRVHDLRIEETVDHSGDPILDITVVLEADESVSITGKALLQLLRRASDYLLARGDQRFPHIHFMTTKDAGAHA